MSDLENSEIDYGIDFERIKELISKYNQIKQSDEIKKYNEETTKKDFILPLFEALGWNVYNRPNRNDSVNAEEKVRRERVDFVFKINGISKFYLEAKPLREENILNKKYVEKAIDYAWYNSISWVILTNFETLAVFNAFWRPPKNKNKSYNIYYYLWKKFDINDLFDNNGFLKVEEFKFLSKNAFEKNLIDVDAGKHYKGPIKLPIDKQLLQDMIYFRGILSKNIIKNNREKFFKNDEIKLKEEVDLCVQQILDRLIFIRNAEDRELEETKLLSLARQISSKDSKQLYKEIKKLFEYYSKNYDSNLFKIDKSDFKCDNLTIDDKVLKEVIEGLNYSEDYSYRYNFAEIKADVLGKIYEQYLGNILEATQKRAKLYESKSHRKGQGIYYTPSIFVEHIIKNTVEKYIKTHTEDEIKKVRILDPACGSGSFLIRAYRELENYWKEHSDFDQQTLDNIDDNAIFYKKKVKILTNNLFGVDIDPKAVEIAQLNLLLQISEKQQILPKLQNNIKVGNSLIDDPNVNDKAFKWKEEFPEIMKEGGFDIIIGNPPYGNLLNTKEKEHLKHIFESNVDEIASLFVEKSIKLLKEKGTLAFVITYAITFNKDLSKTRELLAKNFEEIYISTFDRDRCRMFEDMSQSVSILIAKNKKTSENFGKIFTSNFFRSMPINLDNINYLEVNNYILGDLKSAHRLPKMGDKNILDIINKLNTSPMKVKDILKNYEKEVEPIWIRTSGNYWYNAWNSKPYNSTEIREINVLKDYKNFLILLINSSLFYLYSRVYGDGRHMNMDILKEFPIPSKNQIINNKYEIDLLTNKLMKKLFENFDDKHNRFNTSNIKNIIDESDKLIGKIYNLSEKDIYYIINYDCEIRCTKNLEELEE